MKLAVFLKRLRGKVTGLNAISARVDIIQMQLDGLLSITAQSNAGDVVLEPHLEASAQNVLPSKPLSDSETHSLSKPSLSSFIEFLPREKIRLVFLVITPEVWPSIESVYKRAQNDDRFSVLVVVLKSPNPEIALTSLAKAHSMLETKGISYFTEQNFSLDSYRPHVVFYPIPYESLIPLGFKPAFVAAKGCRIAYVSYGLEVGGGVFNARYQYDTEVPRVAWRIFARSEGQRTNFARYCSYGNGHVVVTGHPRMEIYSPAGVNLHYHASEKAQGRKVILWTPHFSVLTRRKWSSFLDHHKAILRLIEDFPGLFLLVRPHPFLRTSLEKLEGWGPERVAAWFSMINERDNVYVDTETNYRAALEASSALMADAGSFMVEYLRTGKPICHLTGKDDIGLSEEVRSLNCFYPGANEVEIAGFMERVSNGDDPMSEARQSALQIYFGPDNKSPSQSILDEIANEIRNQPQRFYSTEPPASPRDEEAFQYWVNATTTFLAPETYYQEQEIKLRDILNRHAKGRFAVDIGCGNGRFTEMFGEHFEFTEATDPSEQLINEARESAKHKGITNIAYTVERLEHPESLSTYDFVSCMGVTSGLINDEVFIQSIWKLKAAMRPGAKLLMKDTLSLSTPELIESNGCIAVYRNVQAYFAAFEAAGLSLVEELPFAQGKEKCRINGFFLFMGRASEVV
jgi:2-polyprenyl-3-methyl-5-hydroxy-6-metoxy-1,4-benzoquinol methylase